MATQAYATDEDLFRAAPGDYIDLCPDSQMLARAADGAIGAGAWVLSSASTDFAAAGVLPGMLVQLRKPVASLSLGKEDALAVASAATTATLRRVGMAAGEGLLPTVGAATGLTFQVATLRPQILDASADLDKLYRVDDLLTGRAHADLYDPTDVREATVAWVLARIYGSQNRGNRGEEWAHKATSWMKRYEAVIARTFVYFKRSSGSDTSPVPATIRQMRAVR